MYDVIIIGAGPAGISAGIYAKRTGANVLILYHGTSNLEKAARIENYYGYENGIEGKELYIKGINQAKNIGIDVFEDEAIEISKENNSFFIKTPKNKYSSRTVILATGNKKLRPNIDGLLEFEGKGISYCAICDGFFYKNKNVAVIGNGEYAISEANVLKNIASKVTILTNSNKLTSSCEFNVITKKIKSIHGNAIVGSVEFEDGNCFPVDGIFIAIGEAGACDFAKKLGIIINGNDIVVNQNMQTNIDGLFACGDSTGGLFQVSKAVYEGSVAGLSATEYIKNI